MYRNSKWHSIGYDIAPYQHPTGRGATLKATDAMPKPIEVPKTREPSSQQHVQVCSAPRRDERISGNSSSLAMLMMSKLQILQDTDLLHSRQTWRPKDLHDCWCSRISHLDLEAFFTSHQPTALKQLHSGNSCVCDNRYSWPPRNLLESKLRNWQRIRRSDPARCRSLQPAISIDM